MSVSNNIEDHTKESKKKLKDLLKKIRASVYSKGRFMYYDMKLKLVARAKSERVLRSRIDKYMRQDLETRSGPNVYYIFVELTTYDTYRMIFDPESGDGGLHIFANMTKFEMIDDGDDEFSVETLSKRKDKTGVKQKSTILWINYRPDDLQNFRINDTARVAKSLIQAEHEMCILEPEPYKAMKWSRK